MEDDTYTEHPKGVAEIDVASRNIRLDFIAPKIAFKERTLSKLFKEIPNSSERPVFSGKSDGKYVDVLE